MWEIKKEIGDAETIVWQIVLFPNAGKPGYLKGFYTSPATGGEKVFRIVFAILETPKSC